jgi:hypothetical protein
MTTPSSIVLTAERDWKKISLTIPWEADLDEMFTNFDTILKWMTFPSGIQDTISAMEGTIPGMSDPDMEIYWT